MSCLIHCFSEWLMIITFTLLSQPLTQSVGQGIGPICNRFSHKPFLTIAPSALLIRTLIHRGCECQPSNHGSTHLKRGRLDFPPPQSLRRSPCEASFQGRGC
ncbi:hypothetical protein C8J56DRAFT_944806 [Mycena floridula]|nr:hypothetical protein C8J56DRAFT_944806 [Mycena floridula]